MKPEIEKLKEQLKEILNTKGNLSFYEGSKLLSLQKFNATPIGFEEINSDESTFRYKVTGQCKFTEKMEPKTDNPCRFDTEKTFSIKINVKGDNVEEIVNNRVDIN